MARRDVDIFIKAHDQASRQLNQVAASGGKLSSAFGGLGGMVASTFAGFGLANLATSALSTIKDGLSDLVFGTAATGDELARLSQSTGASVEFLSALAYGARKADVDLGNVKVAFKSLANLAVDAANGSKSATEQFGQLGMTVTDAAGKVKSVDRLFLEAAESIRQMGTETEQMAAANAVFGKSGMDILPMVKGGAAGIRDMAAEASKFGQVWSQTQADTASAFDDAWKGLKETFGGVAREIATTVMPLLTQVASAVGEWFRDNRDTIVAVFNDLFGWFREWWGFLLDVAKPAIGAVIKLFAMLWPAFKAVARAIMEAWNSVAAAFEPVFDFLAKGFEAVWWVVDKILTGIVAMVAGIEALATVARELSQGNFNLGSLADAAQQTFSARMDSYFADKNRKTADTFKAAKVELPEIDVPTPVAAGTEKKKKADKDVEQKLSPLVSRMLTRPPGTRDTAAEDRRRQYDEQKKANELAAKQLAAMLQLVDQFDVLNMVPPVIGRF